ncbi:MAG: agmatine deiminase family protein [Geothrix sp.]|uniref:agmatine deiminase family protein n=1 Tax=Geothrix sp. TaxID=1962974 RepID=UPI00179272EC|nr:agmatine deiminase family protein [Geothrix sp.]NWJ41338.1 agmatine deiminase family protein [Geothrix sp.]WIL20674.1 MAG: agmatine deiminase family protein [Geothrix sp.]
MTHPILHQPAEWDRHSACWLAWPSHGHLWRSNLAPAQAEFAALCVAIAEDGGEAIELLVQDDAAEAEARAALAPVLANVRFHRVPVGDIWLRDTAPIFVKDAARALHAACFRFNGWGGKYELPGDDQVAGRVAGITGLPRLDHGWVLEGGSVEVDGEGTVLTTRQCLLNPNRNPEMNQVQIEAALREGLGAEKVLWLDEGLLNDHTDGHIDTLARFVAPGVVVCMEARDPADPNAAILDRLAADLAAMTDARGRRLQVVRIPSPGLLEDEDGEPMPASFVNFYIGNAAVIVPTYGTPFDAEAVAAIARLLPGRRTVGRSARAILSGGGAFHCITQQQPEVL